MIQGSKVATLMSQLKWGLTSMIYLWGLTPTPSVTCSGSTSEYLLSRKEESNLIYATSKKTKHYTRGVWVPICSLRLREINGFKVDSTSNSRKHKWGTNFLKKPIHRKNTLTTVSVFSINFKMKNKLGSHIALLIRIVKCSKWTKDSWILAKP